MAATTRIREICGARQGQVSAGEMASYIADMVAEMERLALSAGLERLAGLLNQAVEEARSATD
ncbi:MAG TPA: hypothetical protein VNH64_06770 [Parvularculaceae bacterium]|nr:hypothetical protein [Parvularculaceae bacterium]